MQSPEDEDDAETSLHVNKDLVIESNIERHNDQNCHYQQSNEAEHYRHSSNRSYEIDSGGERGRCAPYQNQDEVRDQEEIGDASVRAVHEIHAVQAAKESLHELKARPKDKIHRKSNDAEEAGEDGQAREGG